MQVSQQLLLGVNVTRLSSDARQTSNTVVPLIFHWLSQEIKQTMWNPHTDVSYAIFIPKYQENWWLLSHILSSAIDWAMCWTTGTGCVHLHVAMHAIFKKTVLRLNQSRTNCPLFYSTDYTVSKSPRLPSGSKALKQMPANTLLQRQ